MVGRKWVISACVMMLLVGSFPAGGRAAEPTSSRKYQRMMIFEPAGPQIQMPVAIPKPKPEMEPIVVPLPPAVWSGLSALLALGAIAGFKRWRFKRSMNRS